jgi:flavorubredoxin
MPQVSKSYYTLKDIDVKISEISDGIQVYYDSTCTPLGMMVFEETTKSLFASDLFIQPGDSKPVTSHDLSRDMVNLYKGAGIFASEEPVRQTTKRLANLSPKMVFPMHGSCIDDSIFPNYIDAIMNSNFAYIGMLLGQKLDTPSEMVS